MTGRPTLRTDALVDFIIDQVADGIPLAKVLRGEGMPRPSTFYSWLKADEALSERFVRAREDGHEMIAVDALDIADNKNHDYIIDEETGAAVLDRNAVARDKLRFEARMKLLSCWDSGRYGPKGQMELNHKGEISGAFILNVHDTPKPKP